MFLSLLSLTLFSVPIFVTFGIYFAFEHENIMSCGFSCGNELAPGSVPAGPNGGGTVSGGGGVPTGSQPTDYIGKLFCQKSYGIEPSPGNYIFNPNQWGNKNMAEGSLCMNFTNEPSSDGYALGWSATWSYRTQNDPDQPVHAFPNALVAEGLPVKMDDLSGLQVDTQWTYQVGNLKEQTTAIDVAALTKAELNANVCIDMFVAANEDESNDTEKADFEVMVWLGRFGASTDPLGFTAGKKATKTAGGVDFNLYYGVNGNGQTVFTWLAPNPATKFTGDIQPLLEGLTAFNGPKASDYIGYIAFGSETFYQPNQNATLYVPKLEIKLEK